jgi:polar amino acid transport system substrate-binding protein
MKKHVLTVCLIVFGLILASSAFAAKDASWDNVKKAGKIVIGIDDAFPPMEFRTEKNELVGFDIDASKEVAKRLGIKVEHLPTVWDTVILSLKAKKFDVVWSGMSITPEREKEIAFTKPYIMEKQVVVVKKGNKAIKDVKDITEASKMGVQSGSTSEDALKKMNKQFKEVKKYDKNTEALMDLKIGRIDALVVDELVARYEISQSPNVFYVLPTALASEPIGIGLRKEDVALKNKIQKALDSMFKDGTMKKISIKWFGDDITSWK